MILNENATRKARDISDEKLNKLNEEQITSENRAGETARPENISYGKFKSLNELLKAYNLLQTQFTKRSQRLSEVIKENRALKEQANAAAKNSRPQNNGVAPQNESCVGGGDCYSEICPQNMVAEDETGNAADISGEKADVSCAKNENSDVYGAEAERFLKLNPSAVRYVGEIAEKAAETGDLSSGFLERAFIAVLLNVIAKNEAERENDDEIFALCVSRPAVYEKVIRGYLNEIKNKGAAKLMFQSGLTATAPPVKPKNIEEAGALATSFIKQKGVKI